MRTLSFRHVVAGAIAVGAFAVSVVRAGGRTDDDAYLRIVDDDTAQTVRLEVAVRSFAPKDDVGPMVRLVGVVHIGDRAYYDQLQVYLDAQGLVMFEGVKPGAVVPAGADADDASRIKLTRQRVRFLGVLAEQYRTKHKRVPADFAEAIGDEKGPGVQMARAAMVDGWGHEIVYVAGEGAKPRRFDVVSMGSDAKSGGEGAAADLKLSDMKPISKDEASADEGIQLKLARALKLEFQLAVLDYTKANWRNSDMTVEELTKRLNGGEEGEEGEGKQSALMGMLSGQSFGAKVVGVILKFVEISPTMSSMARIMMLEMLGRADELMESQGSAIMGMGGEQLMKVLIDDRNEVVLEDLRRVVKDTPGLKTIAIFYGAGHLPKMQRNLIEDGYVAGETVWFPAITIDLKEFPGGAAMAKSSRDMIRKLLDEQIGKGK